SVVVPVRVWSCLTPPPPRPTLFPYTTLFRSAALPARGTRRPCRRRSASRTGPKPLVRQPACVAAVLRIRRSGCRVGRECRGARRSEEHTSELQSRENLVCRLLLEKKKHRAHT